MVTRRLKLLWAMGTFFVSSESKRYRSGVLFWEDPPPPPPQLRCQCLLVMCSYCFLGATALTYRKTKTGLQPCICKSHGEIIGEEKVVNKPLVGVVQA